MIALVVGGGAREHAIIRALLGEDAGHALEEAHEWIGNAFYAVIAVHALAALWHQFVRRDGTLRRML